MDNRSRDGVGNKTEMKATRLLRGLAEEPIWYWEKRWCSEDDWDMLAICFYCKITVVDPKGLRQVDLHNPRCWWRLAKEFLNETDNKDR